jgi:hypothetical protein
VRIFVEAVGADDELDSVSCVEFGEEVGDVGFGCPDSDVQLFGDLVVGLPRSDEGEHVAFSVGDGVGEGYLGTS